MVGQDFVAIAGIMALVLNMLGMLRTGMAVKKDIREEGAHRGKAGAVLEQATKSLDKLTVRVEAMHEASHQRDLKDARVQKDVEGILRDMDSLRALVVSSDAEWKSAFEELRRKLEGLRQ